MTKIRKTINAKWLHANGACDSGIGQFRRFKSNKIIDVLESDAFSVNDKYWLLTALFDLNCSDNMSRICPASGCTQCNEKYLNNLDIGKFYYIQKYYDQKNIQDAIQGLKDIYHCQK